MIRLALVAVMAAFAPQAANEAANQAAISVGRSLTQWSSAESIETLAKQGSPAFQAGVAEAGGPAAMSRAISDQIGPEEEVLDEFAVTLNGVTAYQRLARYKAAAAALTSANWDAGGVVQGAGIRPAPSPLGDPDRPLPQTALALPFARPRQGEWLTYWGGRNIARNYHVTAPDQAYAYDFLVVRNGWTYQGPKDQNLSYFCWGQPVLAPAAGTVLAVIDGLPDNVPGTMDASQPAGNHVIIEHGPGEYSLIGHLRSRSTVVRARQTVTAGQRIGACGNSGNSSEPHVHYHLQTTGSFGGGAVGLPAKFRDILVDGVRVANAEPLRGQTVAPVR
jgi:murein DD-endopeptidase MepM/ murein hydrolase activator NlpD